MIATTDQKITSPSPSVTEKKLTGLAHLAPSPLTIIFMWLPFGFSLTELLEEWGVIELFSRIGTDYFFCKKVDRQHYTQHRGRYE